MTDVITSGAGIAPATVQVSCPGCKTGNQVPLGATRVVCPNCAQAIVFRKCPATGKGFPVLESWATWSHPGCPNRHAVATTSNARTIASRGKKRARSRTSFKAASGFIFVGLVISVLAVIVYLQPPSATCNGQTMAPGDTCVVTGGSNPGTFDFHQMLSQSTGGNVGFLVVFSLIAALLVVPGIVMVHSTWRSRRRTRIETS